jgi:hypothetical protein
VKISAKFVPRQEMQISYLSAGVKSTHLNEFLRGDEAHIIMMHESGCYINSMVGNSASVIVTPGVMI